MLGFKFVTSRALDYLKAQNRIANEKLRDKEAEIKTLRATVDNLKAELMLYKASIPDPNDLPLLNEIIAVVEKNDKYTDAIKLFAGIWRRYDK